MRLMEPNKKEEKSTMEETQVLLSLLSHTSHPGAIKTGVLSWSLGRSLKTHSPTALHRAERCQEHRNQGKASASGSALQRELEELKPQ